MPRLPRLSLLFALATVALPAMAQENRIVAIVNGSVISRDDVENRERLFALSTGLRPSAELLDRLAPQISRALIDERLQLQEMLRRKIVVSDQDLALALAEIEQRNGMKSGELRAKLANQGVALRTLIDQIRVQIGWTRVLHDQLGSKAEVSDTDIADRAARLKAQAGQVQYRVSEIFIPADQPSQAAEARGFAETVISQLRAGAPFAIVAAEFSAAQSALQGGDMGWVSADGMDPDLAKVVAEMPVGAVSNPIPIPGGLTIAALRAKRELGKQQSTALHIRQVFLPFEGTLNPAAPTPAQTALLARSQQISTTAKSCADMDAAAAAVKTPRPADPGELRLENIPDERLRAMLASQPIGKPSTPLVAQDGIAVIMVCSRETLTDPTPPKGELTEQIISERVDLASRQLIADLRRRAIIDRRSAS